MSGRTFGILSPFVGGDIQYDLGIELLGTHAGDPRGLGWLGRTPAVAGCLGLWQDSGDDKLDVVGRFRVDGEPPGGPLPAGDFPPDGLFASTDGPAGDIVFLVPVRSRGGRDWGVLAAWPGSSPPPRRAGR